MCCLFGLIDPKNVMPARFKNDLLHLMAKQAEDRGKDATGIAYLKEDELVIYKKPVAGRRMHFKVPEGTTAVMGHTRLTTQGDAKFNYNNHPFRGKSKDGEFAMAHNGMVWGSMFSNMPDLPPTHIQTDSYLIVQLLELEKHITLTSLKNVSEQLHGSFSYTILDKDNSLYFIKGDNPLCIYYSEKYGYYLYASTEEILRKAIQKSRLRKEPFKRLILSDGEILKISRDGSKQYGQFLMNYSYSYSSFSLIDDIPITYDTCPEELCTYAQSIGVPKWQVKRLWRLGFTYDELAELLYQPDMFQAVWSDAENYDWLDSAFV